MKTKTFPPVDDVGSSQFSLLDKAYYANTHTHPTPHTPHTHLYNHFPTDFPPFWMHTNRAQGNTKYKIMETKRKNGAKYKIQKNTQRRREK